MKADCNYKFYSWTVTIWGTCRKILRGAKNNESNTLQQAAGYLPPRHSPNIRAAHCPRELMQCLLNKFFNPVKFTVVLFPYIGYNRVNLKCAITPVYFWTYITLNGIPILPGGCQALTHMRIGREGKRQVAVTHLASLGVKKQGAAFWGYRQKRRAVLRGCSFVRAVSLAGACSHIGRMPEARRGVGSAWAFEDT